ncbi:Nucleolar protein 12 [Sporothrix epigloea]|uniref:Nucleolar protein 12 n=1 Tax=Sporothrix epigloea TaxID=1892477 RepID=A0ABP0DJ38_9PEZI
MAPSKSVLVPPKKAVDPLLDALFSSSVKPAETRTKPKYEPLLVPKPRAAPIVAPVKPLNKYEKEAASDDDNSQEEDEENEDVDSNDGNEGGEEEEKLSTTDEKVAAAPAALNNGASKRKRKSRDENDDLESRYFDKLEKEIDGPAGKKTKRVTVDSNAEKPDTTLEGDGDNEADEVIVHESLLQNEAGELLASDVADGNLGEEDKAKADRTVFLSNVSISAITGKAAKKTLITHLESIFDEESAKSVTGSRTNEKAGVETLEEDAGPAGDDKKKKTSVLESLRFRSTPFASAALPKRASFITKAVMGATAQSTNAYAIYTTPAAARAAVRKLNGTVVLDRHLRADSVSHPSPVDHRRCVFVGNLGFVDDETVLSANPEADGDNGGGEMTRKKRNKTPMDVEEGLWRTFTKHAGKVESVRVIRDQVTRVGKGIAYVQFYDSTSVEAALLLADKKFPPLLPRALRVSRCKAPYKTARALERAQEKASGKTDSESRKRRRSSGGNGTTGYKPKLTAEQQTSAGRASKLLGKSAATTPLGAAGPDGKPMVFEGMRARVGGVNLFKKGKGGKKGGAGGRSAGPTGKEASRKQARQAKRAAEWRAKKSEGA